MLSTLNAEQFIEITQENMTLMHHIAFDGNQEAFLTLKALPYFRDILDADNNEVCIPPIFRFSPFDFKFLNFTYRKDGPHFCGLLLRKTQIW
jgi:hypothetical protein